MRKNLRGFGVGARVGEGGGGGVAVGGGALADGGGVGGVRGVGGLVLILIVGAVPVKAASLTFDALIVVATRPGGRGSEVAELLDPGRTTGFESLILDFFSSAYPL